MKSLSEEMMFCSFTCKPVSISKAVEFVGKNSVLVNAEPDAFKVAA